MKTSLLMMGLIANIKSKQNVKCVVNVKIKQIFEPNVFVSVYLIPSLALLEGGGILPSMFFLCDNSFKENF